MADNASNVEWTRNKVAEQLDRIAQYFVSGSKLTLIVRQADKPEQDFMLTNDDIGEAIAVLERSKGRPVT